MKQQHPPKLLTKGAALMKARDLLGPSASVFQKGSMVYIGVGPIPARHPMANIVASAPSWESAIMIAEDSPAATEWNDHMIDEGNAIALAEDNLKKTRKAVSEKRVQDFFRNIAEELQLKTAAKEANKLDYAAWQAKREARFV